MKCVLYAALSFRFYTDAAPATKLVSTEAVQQLSRFLQPTFSYSFSYSYDGFLDIPEDSMYDPTPAPAQYVPPSFVVVFLHFSVDEVEDFSVGLTAGQEAAVESALADVLEVSVYQISYIHVSGFSVEERRLKVTALPTAAMNLRALGMGTVTVTAYVALFESTEATAAARLATAIEDGTLAAKITEACDTCAALALNDVDLVGSVSPSPGPTPIPTTDSYLPSSSQSEGSAASIGLILGPVFVGLAFLGLGYFGWKKCFTRKPGDLPSGANGWVENKAMLGQLRESSDVVELAPPMGLRAMGSRAKADESKSTLLSFSDAGEADKSPLRRPPDELDRPPPSKNASDADKSPLHRPPDELDRPPPSKNASDAGKSPLRRPPDELDRPPDELELDLPGIGGGFV